MAGFLGTLFMGNVGLRLLLPPKSAYNKMASEFGANAKKIGQMGTQEQKKTSKFQLESSKSSLLKSRLLFNRAAQDNSSDAIRNLQKELQQLDIVTQGAVSRLDKTLGAGALNRKKSVFGGKDLADMQELLEGVEGIAGVKSPDEYVDQFAQKIESMTTGVLNAFNNSITTSVTALTTLGFQVQMAARSLISYENELVNANSIFQVSNDELYSISNEVVDVGLQYALTYDNMSQALYQFASAGLDASESQQILADVMKLSMAVQGDSETLGKLLIQTIKGFGMEFSDSAKLVDQFALAINESLLEYQDLASAVKFAMPFFVSTNQGVEQLLGGLAILTDRALEAGIAGRGLRQALAELAESLGDNTRKFQEMGINITDAQGNLLQMTDIAAEFAKHFGEAANDTELLTTLISDLNVRGATAFVHLVQNSEEYAEVTNKLANAQGDATRMADKQMESLSNQIIVTKNAMMAAFLYGEVQEDGTMGINSFHEALLDLVKTFRSRFVVELDDGRFVLSEFGFQLRDIATRFVVQLNEVIAQLLDFIVSLSTSGFDLVKMLDILFFPLKVVVDLMSLLPESTRGTAMEFLLLSRMVGRTGAMYILFGQAVTNFTARLADGNVELEKTLNLITAIAGLGITALSLFPAFRVGRGLYTAARGASFGPNMPAGMAMSRYAAQNRGMIAMAGASGIMGFPGATLGLGMTATGLAGYSGAGEDTGGDAGLDYEQYLSDINTVNTATSPTTLNVQTANFRTDNLNETFYSSQYTT